LIEQAKAWVKAQYWSRRDHRSASAGTADAGLPVVLNSLGKLALSLISPLVGNLIVDGYIRVRQTNDTNKRSDRQVAGGITTINSYDDNAAVYLPINLDATIITFNGNFGSWTNITFNTGWVNFGAGYQTGQYRKVGDMVFLRGLVVRTSGADANITTLPTLHRPPANMLYDILSNDLLGRVDISTAGVVTLTIGAAANWVNLSDIPPFSIT
jgi:hypothetical protein